MSTIRAGAGSVDITPRTPQFLYGYPHVPRISTGVHDPLLATALCVDDGTTAAMFIANDLIFVTRALADRVRARLAELTGVPAAHIMVTATHTHSGPVTVRYLSNEADPVVPEPDPAYLRQAEEGIIEAGRQAWESRRPAEAALAVADGSAVGTNRRDPAGPRDPHVPVLLVRAADTHDFIAAMAVCSMHPTVLHEDSTLISGDLPAMARRYVQEHLLGSGCPVVCHIGAAANQSPRYVTRGNTFEEADRLGRALGEAVVQTAAQAGYRQQLPIVCGRELIADLPLRTFPAPDEAARRVSQAHECVANLRRAAAPRAAIRTAECDAFGAEETFTLARAAVEGRLQAAADTCLPVEVQLIRIGPWSFIGWPGEVSVEFGLTVKARSPDTYVITLANGELQGYVVTADIVAEGGYEANNALFKSPDAGDRLVEAAMRLLSA